MIRPARPDDLRAIARLGIEIFADAMPYEVDEEHVVNSLAMLMFSNGYVRVAEVDGKIVGFLVGMISVAGLWTRDTCAIEAKFGIHPAYRGRTLARDMVRGFEEWAARSGVRDVLMVGEAGLKGKSVGRFYERLGYVAMETVYWKRVVI